MPADAPLEDLLDMSEYAERVRARFRVALSIDGPLSRPRPGAWFLARAETAEARRAPVERRVTPIDREPPLPVKAGLNNAHKPFHLWNVERPEWREKTGFDPIAYKLGRAALDNGPSREGQPGTVTPASAIAAEGWRERTSVSEEAWRQRRALFALLSEARLGRTDAEE